MPPLSLRRPLLPAIVFLVASSGLPAAYGDEPRRPEVAPLEAAKPSSDPPLPSPSPRVMVTVEPPRPHDPADDVPSPQEIAAWNEHAPIPAGYHPVKHARTSPIVVGAVLFSTLYLLSVATAASSASSPRSSEGSLNVFQTGSLAGLYVPGAGPFIAVSQVPGFNLASDALLVDGLIQTIGMALVVYGIAAPRTILEPDTTAALRLLPRPIRFGGSGAGLGVGGSF